MNHMHLRKLDLNLLVLFRTLMLQRTVTGTAKTLRLSQSAVSHALARLRLHYGDPLFLRVGAKMEPTGRAKELAPMVDQALKTIEETFIRQFDPKSLREEFRIGLVNFGALYLVPALLGKLATEAPAVRIIVDHVPEQAASGMLDRSEIDMIIGSVATNRKSWESEALFVDRFAVIAAADNAEIGKTISADRFLAAEHIHIPFFDGIEDTFAKLGAKRRFVLSSDNLLSVLFIVARSKLIAVMPATVPRIYSGVYGVKLARPPIQLPPCIIEMIHHRRDHEDVAHVWLRQAIRDLAFELGSIMGTLPASRRPRRRPRSQDLAASARV